MTPTLTQDATKALEFFESKVAFTTGPVELDRMIKTHADIAIIDVRAEEDYEKGHVPGAINLPKEKWGTLQGLEKNKTNVVYCYSQQCHLAANACVEFARNGYPVMELEGGFDAWKEHDLDVDKASINRLIKQKTNKLFNK